MTNEKDDAANGQESTIDDRIEHLEEKIAALRPAALSEELSPAKGMAMLRKARAKNGLAKARNIKFGGK